jgi:predicted nucleic acid-binding protein
LNIEFASTVWKKRRIGDISDTQARIVLQAFEGDFTKYTFAQLDNVVVEQARNLLATYGQLGLRTLDSLQLATAVSLRNQAGLFVSADQLLRSCLSQENLPVQ